MLTNNLTAVITALERPASLERLFHSLRRFYPALPVIVVDTGTKPADLPSDKLEYRQRGDLQANVSAARNAGVAEAQSELVLILDDDLEFCERTNLDAMEAVLADPAISFVGGNCLDVRSKVEVSFAADLTIEPWKDGLKQLVVRAPKAQVQKTVGGIRYQPCTMVSNFLLARRDALVAVRWNETLPLCEMWDFSLRCPAGATAYCPDSLILHHRDRPAGYEKWRDREQEFKKEFMRQWGIERVVAKG